MWQASRTSDQIRRSKSLRTGRSAPRTIGRSGAKSESAVIAIADIVMKAKRAEHDVKDTARRSK